MIDFDQQQRCDGVLQALLIDFDCLQFCVPKCLPYANGTTHVLFEPLGLLAKLAALIHRPRVNLTRYHGLFAWNSKLRASLVSGKTRKKRTKQPGVRKVLTTYSSFLRKLRPNGPTVIRMSNHPGHHSNQYFLKSFGFVHVVPDQSREPPSHTLSHPGSLTREDK